MRFKSIFSAVILLGFGTTAMAAGSDSQTEDIRKILGEKLPEIEISSVGPSPVAGVFELISAGQIYYVTGDGKYIFDGNLIDMESRTNLTTARLGGVHMSLINAMGEDNMLIFQPEKSAERSITVFTDTSCPYCSKLHAEIDVLLEHGVSVRYLMFPRAGIGSQAHRDLESVWCADNQQEAMTTAKAGGSIPTKTCDNPIESHIALAEQVGLRGTPLIYIDDGQMIPGYRSADDLVEMIQNSEPL